MTKVNITREVAEVIEFCRERGEIVRLVAIVAEKDPIGYKRYAPVMDLDLYTLMSALVNGYEETAELPIVTVEHFGALNLLAHHYDVLAGLIANYTSVELDDLVKNGYRTK